MHEGFKAKVCVVQTLFRPRGKDAPPSDGVVVGENSLEEDLGSGLVCFEEEEKSRQFLAQ
jgi:hypothetical protein